VALKDPFHSLRGNLVVLRSRLSFRRLVVGVAVMFVTAGAGRRPTALVVTIDRITANSQLV
jgi:hypothetical protein